MGAQALQCGLVTKASVSSLGGWWWDQRTSMPTSLLSARPTFGSLVVNLEAAPGNGQPRARSSLSRERAKTKPC